MDRNTMHIPRDASTPASGWPAFCPLQKINEQCKRIKEYEGEAIADSDGKSVGRLFLRMLAKFRNREPFCNGCWRCSKIMTL
jgi:hypothetical protein